MNLDGRSIIKNPELIAADKWIYSRLNSAAKSMRDAFLSYRYNDAAITAYEFFWNDFCDWYVEATKLSIKGSGDGATDDEKNRATTVLLDVLAKSLKLLHPLLPFITEEIYSKLPNKSDGFLITAAYPEYDKKLSDEKAEKDFAFLQELVRQVRTLRSECTVPPDRRLKVTVRTRLESLLAENSALVRLLAGLAELEIESSQAGKDRPAGSIGLAGNGFEAFVFVAEAVDLKLLKQKFAKDLEKDKKYIEGLKAKLANEDFVNNAPTELVAAEKLKLEEGLARYAKLESYIRDIA
jgi:valyl-tRNA synthetase